MWRRLFVFGSILSAVFGNCAEMKVTWIGHATTLLEAGKTCVLTDPCWRNKILGGLKRRNPPALVVNQLPPLSLVVVSHTHPDHYDPDAIVQLPGTPVVVLPWGRGGELRKKGVTVLEMRPGDIQTVNGVRVSAFRARHMWGHCLSYLFEMEGQKIFYPGDNRSLKGLKEISAHGVDLMLTPYGGTPVIGSIWTTDQAVEAVRLISPRFVIPIHWGSFARWWTRRQPVAPNAFLEKICAATPSCKCHLLKPGDIINISSTEVQS